MGLFNVICWYIDEYWWVVFIFKIFVIILIEFEFLNGLLGWVWIVYCLEYVFDVLISMVLLIILIENDVFERINGLSVLMSVIIILFLLNKSLKKVKRDLIMILLLWILKKLKGEGMRVCGLLMMKSIIMMVSIVRFIFLVVLMDVILNRLSF